jgi:threonine synthase
MTRNLLDLARTFEFAVSQESRKFSEMAKDRSLSLVDRVESFEDVMNIEIGDTSLSRARNLEREH